MYLSTFISVLYTVPSTNIDTLVNMSKGLSFWSFIQKIHKLPTYHWSKSIESGGRIVK